MEKFFKIVGIVLVSILLAAALVCIGALGWPTIRNAYNQLSTPTMSASAALEQFTASRNLVRETGEQITAAQRANALATDQLKTSTELARAEVERKLMEINATSIALNSSAGSIGAAITNFHEQTVLGLAHGVNTLLSHMNSNSLSGRVTALEGRIGSVETNMASGFGALNQSMVALAGSITNLAHSVTTQQAQPMPTSVPSYNLCTNSSPIIGVYQAGRSLWAVGMKKIFLKVSGSVSGVDLAHTELAVREWVDGDPKELTGLLRTRGDGREAAIEAALGKYLKDKFPGKPVRLQAELR
jgi:hypothetical protein